MVAGEGTTGAVENGVVGAGDAAEPHAAMTAARREAATALTRVGKRVMGRYYGAVVSLGKPGTSAWI